MKRMSNRVKQSRPLKDRVVKTSWRLNLLVSDRVSAYIQPIDHPKKPKGENPFAPYWTRHWENLLKKPWSHW